MHLRRLIVAAIVAVPCVTAGVWFLSVSVPPLRKAAPSAPRSPSELWSIQAEGERPVGRLVQICADDKLRAGFTLFTLEFGAVQCPIEHLHRHGSGQNYTCRVGDREFGVSTTIDGRPDQDFVTRTDVTDIEDAKTVYRRILRFKRMGPCPPGWPTGDATDQQGRRVTAAFLDGAGLPAYPHG